MRIDEGLSSLDARERALATRLVLGVVATSGTLDAIIDTHLSARAHLEPRVRDALRVAAFELLYLGTPASAAVSQGVELTRRAQPRATGLANAVLRRIGEKDEPCIEAARARVAEGGAAERDLALLAGLPTWLVTRIAADLGPAAARDLALAQLEPAPVYVAANLLARTAGEACALLEDAGLEPTPTSLPACWALGAPAGLAASGLVTATDVLPADFSAQLVCAIAAPEPGSRMLEVGQGRATKTLVMEGVALQLGGLAHIDGIDVVPHKVRVATRRCEPFLAGWATSTELDALALATPDVSAIISDAYDSVLVDAPCSGTGTMRRHPEIPWSLEASMLDAQDPGSLVSLQIRMLAAASTRVRPGGTLTYATCSVLAVEDEDVVEAFLASPQGADFRLASALDAPGLATAGSDARALVEASLTGGAYVKTHPAKGAPDGHFCARMVRVG